MTPAQAKALKPGTFVLTHTREGQRLAQVTGAAQANLKNSDGAWLDVRVLGLGEAGPVWSAPLLRSDEQLHALPPGVEPDEATLVDSPLPALAYQVPLRIWLGTDPDMRFDPAAKRMVDAVAKEMVADLASA